MRSIFLSLAFLIAFSGTSFAAMDYSNQPNAPKSEGYIIENGTIKKAGDSLGAYTFYIPENCSAQMFKNLEKCVTTQCTMTTKSSKGETWIEIKESLLGMDDKGRCHIISEAKTADQAKPHTLECYLRESSRMNVLRIYLADTSKNTLFGFAINAAKMSAYSGSKDSLVSQSAGAELQEDCNPRKWKKYDPNKPTATGPDLTKLQAQMLNLQKTHPELEGYKEATPEEQKKMIETVMTSVSTPPAPTQGNADKPENGPTKSCDGFAAALSDCKKFSCAVGDAQFGVGGIQDNGTCYVTASDAGKFYVCDVSQNGLAMLSAAAGSAAVQPSSFMASLQKLSKCH